MSEEWRYKDGFRPRGKVPANVVGATVKMMRNAGMLTPSGYVKYATPKTSPTHATLTWDNIEAAREYRLIEARRIIRAVEVVVTTSASEGSEAIVTVVEHVHVPDRAGRGEGRYVASDVIAEDTDDYAAALAEARSRFESARSAFRRLQRVTEGREDRSVVISIAAEGFSTVERALTMLA